MATSFWEDGPLKDVGETQKVLKFGPKTFLHRIKLENILANMVPVQLLQFPSTSLVL